MYYKIYKKSTKIDLNKIESFSQMKDWIETYKKNHKEKKIKILDIGCGIGYLTNFLNAEGLDNNINAIKMANKFYPNNKFFQGDINKILNILKDKYDIIVCYNIIEHLQDKIRIKFFNNINKIFNKDGMIIFGYANPYHPVQLFWGFLTKKVLFDKTHIHNWTIKQFRKEISKYFQILEEKKTSPFTRFIYIGKHFKGDILIRCKIKKKVNSFTSIKKKRSN